MSRIHTMIWVLLSLVSLALWSCKDEEVTCRFETAPLQGGVTQGEIVQLHVYCNDKESFPGSISVSSGTPPIASVRETPDRITDEHKGFYLLAHRPGTVTLTASRSGSPAATAQITIHPQ
jgi:hypothetical protein